MTYNVQGERRGAFRASLSTALHPGDGTSRLVLTTPVIMASPPPQDANQNGAPHDGRSAHTRFVRLDGGSAGVLKPSAYPQPFRTRQFRYRWQQSFLGCLSRPADELVVRRSQCRAEHTLLCCSVVVMLSFVLRDYLYGRLSWTSETYFTGNDCGVETEKSLQFSLQSDPEYDGDGSVDLP